MENDFDFTTLKEWATGLLDIRKEGRGTTPPLLLDKECLNDDVVSIREVQELSCKKPHQACGNSYGPFCQPWRVQLPNIPIQSTFNLKMLEYKEALEKITSDEECTVELIRKVFTLCYDLHTIADLERQNEKLVRDTLRYKQNGFCVIPGCKNQKHLNLHHCLAESLGGETSENNCVLVCTIHHASLEKFRSKVEVMEYIKSIKN
jgi:hypothetical protein